MVAAAVGRLDELPTLLRTAKVVQGGSAAGKDLGGAGGVQLSGGGKKPKTPGAGCAC